MYKPDLPIVDYLVELSRSSKVMVHTAQLLILYKEYRPGLFSFLGKTKTKEFILNLDTLKFNDGTFSCKHISITGRGDDASLHTFFINLTDRNVMSSKISRQVLDLNNIVFGVEHQSEYCLVLQVRKPGQHIELLWLDIPSIRFAAKKITGTINLYQSKVGHANLVSCVDTHEFVLEKVGTQWVLSVK